MEEKELQDNIAKVKKEVKDITNMDYVEDLIKDNSIEFKYNDETYRVIKPSFAHKEEVNRKRIEKYTELLKDENALLEADLIALYKKRNIDIDDMTKKYEDLNSKRNDSMLKLGKAIKDKQPKGNLEKYKNEIKTLNGEMQILALHKTVLLDSSIESQINVFVYTYLSYLIAQKKVQNKGKTKWAKAWKDYQDFVDEEEGLVNQIVWYGTLISRNELTIK